jgi:predicted Fe-S protein YdhL (DUF1289 family)
MSDDVWRRDEVESPCVKVCVLHPVSGLCLGCWRSGAEIAAWPTMTAAERRALLAELPARASRLRGARRGGRAARRPADDEAP